jgi:hypothetical protein
VINNPVALCELEEPSLREKRKWSEFEAGADAALKLGEEKIRHLSSIRSNFLFDHKSRYSCTHKTAAIRKKQGHHII